MRLESALYSGRSGIIVHGQAISLIGDNLANSNTTGYKESRIEFCDLLTDQCEASNSTLMPAAGSGVGVRSVRQVFEGGILESTGRSLDVGIDGNGFFLVGEAAAPNFTRAGNFSINEDGLLVDNDGQPVLGFAPGATALSSLNLYNLGTASTATTQASMVGNVNASSETTAPPTNPQSFSEIRAAASYIGSLTVNDSLGATHDIAVAFFKTGANTWTAQAFIDGSEVGGTAGVPVQVGQNLALNFSSSGVIDPANQPSAVITATPNYSNGAAAGNFSISLGSFTQYAAPPTLTGVSQNGKSAGNIRDYEIQPNGEIYATLDSGAVLLAGTLQLADFPNREGLERIGNNTYRAGNNTGAMTSGSPGVGSLGRVQGGALELSTVDMTEQFVDLVLYQRGYQANSQTISVANQMIRDTIQLMR